MTSSSGCRHHASNVAAHGPRHERALHSPGPRRYSATSRRIRSQRRQPVRARRGRLQWQQPRPQESDRNQGRHTTRSRVEIVRTCEFDLVERRFSESRSYVSLTLVSWPGLRAPPQETRPIITYPPTGDGPIDPTNAGTTARAVVARVGSSLLCSLACHIQIGQPARPLGAHSASFARQNDGRSRSVDFPEGRLCVTCADSGDGCDF